MASRFNISILGDRALEQALAALPDKVERNILTKSLRQAGGTVLRDAQRRAPTRAALIAPGTGKRRAKQLRKLAIRFARLRNTLKLKAMKRRKGRVGYVVMTGTREELGIPANATAYYPAAVEYGHAAPGRRRAATQQGLRGRFLRHHLHGAGGGRRTPPHPYMRPALNSNKGQILSQLASDIAQRIEHEAKG